MRRFQVSIQRSELCAITDSVGEWEIPLLQLVHGAEKIAIGGFTKDTEAYPAAAVEFERLERRYGENPSTGNKHVAELYGPAPGGIRILLQAIKDAATERNTPQSMNGGGVELDDELHQEIEAPVDEVDLPIDAPDSDAQTAPPAVVKKAVAKPTPKAAAKQTLPKSAKAPIVATPAQPTDPIGELTGDPLSIEE